MCSQSCTPEPIFCEKLEEMKAHGQYCLSLSLVAQPNIAPLDKGKGVGKGRGRGTWAPARGGPSKAGPDAPADKVDSHLLDVSDDEDIVVEDDSNATEKSK